MSTEHKLTPPERVAKPGFKYHYKHDPDGPINNYAYVILGTGHHTEDNARPEDKFMQVYLPLYSSALVYQMGQMFDLRPLDMALDTVGKNDYVGPRFIDIEDEAVIAELKKIALQMYGPWFW